MDVKSENAEGCGKVKSKDFRSWVTEDGSSGFKAEKGRYHLYAAWGCPYANRTLIGRKIKGLEDVITLNVVHTLNTPPEGWIFLGEEPETTLDTVNGCKSMKEIYDLVDPEYCGRFTVPVLWDKQKKTIVSNESAEILHMFNNAFNQFCATDEQRNLDLCPESKRKEIEELNRWIASEFNVSVYTAGFAKDQQIYNAAVTKVFTAMDKMEDILSNKRYLTGDSITEADIRAFTTLVRFDKVYNCLFKCNKKRLVDYPNLWGYARDLYQTPGFHEMVKFDYICKTYWEGMRFINPNGIIPIGPDADWMSAHNRERLNTNNV